MDCEHHVCLFVLFVVLPSSLSVSLPLSLPLSPLLGIDAVICSAGASHPSLFIATSERDFERLMQINYTGIVYVLKAVVPHLIRNGPARGGRVMLVSSMAGLSGVAGYTAYGASKFALRGLAESLHMELSGPHGVAVSVANPPDVDTPMLARENEFKPRECLQISEGSGVFQARHIAADIVGAMKRWRFLVNTGMDGQMLALIASGTSPAHSGTRARGARGDTPRAHGWLQAARRDGRGSPKPISLMSNRQMDRPSGLTGRILFARSFVRSFVRSFPCLSLVAGLVGVLESVSLGALRVISLVYRWHYNRIVARVHDERVSGKLDDEGARAFRRITNADADASAAAQASN